MTNYNARVEWATREADDDALVDALVDYSPALSRSPRGWVEAWITLPALSLQQACTTALAVAGAALPGVEVLAVEVMPTAEFDRRLGVTPVAETVGVPEAADILGVTQQAVRQRLASGSLVGERVGRDWRIARTAVEAARS